MQELELIRHGFEFTTKYIPFMGYTNGKFDLIVKMRRDTYIGSAVLMDSNGEYLNRDVKTIEDVLKHIDGNDKPSQQVEGINQMKERFFKCEDILKSIKGTFITPSQAKELNKLSRGGFKIIERKLSDSQSLVVMERQTNNKPSGTAYIFIVKGGKQLHFKLNQEKKAKTNKA